MNVFSHFLQRWKHSDPRVRAQAIRKLGDNRRLEVIAVTDPDESVRIAAVETMVDQEALGRFACGSTPLASVAVHRINVAPVLIRVAQLAELPAVRELAVDRIDDREVLARIAASDLHTRVRFKARSRLAGSDRMDYVRARLNKLGPAPHIEVKEMDFCGPLDVVCATLLRDGRFEINCGCEDTLPPFGTRVAFAVPKLTSHWADDLPEECARFVALKRGEEGQPEPASSEQKFYEIRVWRLDSDRFAGCVMFRQLKLVCDPVAWSRSSSDPTFVSERDRDQGSS